MNSKHFKSFHINFIAYNRMHSAISVELVELLLMEMRETTTNQLQTTNTITCYMRRMWLCCFDILCYTYSILIVFVNNRKCIDSQLFSISNYMFIFIGTFSTQRKMNEYLIRIHTKAEHGLLMHRTVILMTMDDNDNDFKWHLIEILPKALWNNQS